MESKKLNELAKSPYDLTKPEALNPERVGKYSAEACGYKLLYSTERVNDEVMQALFELAASAKVFEKMEAMQAGEVCNKIEGFPSENRKVLHTATRDFFHPNPSASAKEAAKLAKPKSISLKLLWVNLISLKTCDDRHRGLQFGSSGPLFGFGALEEAG